RFFCWREDFSRGGNEFTAETRRDRRGYGKIESGLRQSSLSAVRPGSRPAVPFVALCLRVTVWNSPRRNGGHGGDEGTWVAGDSPGCFFRGKSAVPFCLSYTVAANRTSHSTPMVLPILLLCRGASYATDLFQSRFPCLATLGCGGDRTGADRARPRA